MAAPSATRRFFNELSKYKSHNLFLRKNMDTPRREYKKHGISVSFNGNVHVIKFDNVPKRNCISREAYDVLVSALKEAENDPEVTVTVLTGAGSYYSSGFDISASADDSGFDESLIEIFVHKLRNFIDALIDYPKLLIAVVNGPALGIAVTTLALCDVIFASETATFRTPFTQLGLCAEGCSSYTFPKILGPSKANEMLLLSQQMSAVEAKRYGFVSEIFKQSEMEQIWDKIVEFSKLPRNSLRCTKSLIRTNEKNKLHEINAMELDTLIGCFKSDEFMESVIAFMTRKVKSKY